MSWPASWQTLIPCSHWKDQMCPEAIMNVNWSNILFAWILAEIIICFGACSDIQHQVIFTFRKEGVLKVGLKSCFVWRVLQPFLVQKSLYLLTWKLGRGYWPKSVAVCPVYRHIRRNTDAAHVACKLPETKIQIWGYYKNLAFQYSRLSLIFKAWNSCSHGICAWC